VRAAAAEGDELARALLLRLPPLWPGYENPTSRSH
jgi:hypothetical protein